MQKAGVIFSSFAMVLFLASVSLAAGTSQLNVSASVVGTCKFNTVSSALGFGALPVDASGTALGASATASPAFWCTKGASYTITDDLGLNEAVASTAPRRMKSTTLGTPEFIDYSIAYTATGTGSGPGTPITLTVTGTVGTTYTANSADAYADTVTLSINP